jgi:hypothetical protein
MGDRSNQVIYPCGADQHGARNRPRGRQQADDVRVTIRDAGVPEHGLQIAGLLDTQTVVDRPGLTHADTQ